MAFAGALDWVMERTPERPDHEHETEWRGLLLSRPAEFSMSVDAYRDELGCQIQNTEIHLRLRAGFMAPRVAYGPSHRPFVESIFSKDPELAGLRTEFESALNNGELAEARGLSEKISLTLLDRIAI